MKIDFNLIAEKVIPNFKGGLKEYNVKMADDGKVKIMRGRLVPGASIGMHAHVDSCEVIYVLSGQGYVASPDGDEVISAGEVSYCPQSHAHSLINKGEEDLIFLGIVPQF